MAPSGAPPRCSTCRSLERHRGFRLVFEALRPLDLASRSALQFSDDPAVDPAWFAAHEISVFGGANSLDLAAIDRPDGCCDVVICNHVLEHVADDRAALAELDRVLAQDGWLFLSVPDPLRVLATVEYGRRRDDKHGHFRLYGPDIEARFAETVPAWKVVRATARDPVTGAPDRCFLLTRSAAEHARLLAAIGAAGVTAAPATPPLTSTSASA
jgi:SAM-dependent methyltransferase